MTGLSCAARIVATAIWNRRKPQGLRGIIFVLAILMVAPCVSGAALAGSVTAPAGPVQNYQSSLTVNWNGIASSGGVANPVDVDLVVGTGNTLIGIMAFANNVANNGHYTLALPSGGCHELPPGYFYQIIVQAGFLQPGADWGASAPFQFNCPHVISKDTFARRIFSTGSLTPYKGPARFGDRGQPSGKSVGAHSPQSGGQGSLNILEGVGFTQGLPVPPNFLNFTMTVNCTPSGPVNQTVAVSSTNPAGLTIAGIAANSVCTVSEVPLALVAHAPDCGGGWAHWTYQPPQSVTIAANSTAHVTMANWLQCGPSSGWVSVNKVVVNTTGAPVPATFAMTAHCNESTGPTTMPLSLQAHPGYWENFGVDVGSSCTITEAPLAPIAHVKSCNGGSASWTTSYAPAQPVIAVDSADGTLTHVTVTNTLTCDKPPPSGHVTVTKAVINATGGPVPSMPSSFNVTVHCTPSGPLGTVLPVPANGGVSLAAPVAPGSTCSVHEAQLPDIMKLVQCKGASASWTTTYSPGVVIMAGVTSTMTVTNRLACNSPPPPGSLRTIKTVINATGGLVSMPASFAMKVDCLPSGPTQQAIAVAPGSNGTTVGNIAAPSSCKVTEDQLASIQHAEGCKGGSASWTTLTAPTQPVGISANATTTVTVRNTLTCDKPAATGSLEIIKRVVNDSQIPPPDINFYVDVDCQPGGPTETVKLNSSNSYHDTVSGIALGASCTITEEPPAVPADLARRGCHWETSYPGDQRIPVDHREGARGEVVNHWICKDGGGTGDGRYDLGIQKTAGSPWSSGSAGVFHLVVINNGAAIAPPMSVTVSDSLTNSFTFVAAAGSGWTCGASAPISCTYSGTVAAGQSLPPISVTVLAGHLTSAKNCATVSLNGGQDSVSGNNMSCIGIKFDTASPGNDNRVMPYGGSSGSGIDVGIANTVISGTLPENSTGTFELTVTNYGASLKEKANLMVRDVLPNGLVLQSAMPASSAMHCRTTDSDVLCRVMGDFPSGSQARLRVNVRALHKGTFNNCASVQLVAATDAVPGNNTACATLRFGLDTGQTPTMPPALIVPPPPPKHENKPKATPDDHYDVPKGP